MTIKMIRKSSTRQRATHPKDIESMASVSPGLSLGCWSGADDAAD